MPYNRPTLEQLIPRVQTDLDNNLNNNAARQRGTYEYAASHANAGLCHSLHGHIVEVGKNAFIQTCDDEHLLIHGDSYGLSLHQPTAASFEVQFFGQEGTVIVAGTAIQSSSGVVYTTNVEVEIAAGEVDVVATVTATLDYLGTQGNVYGGQILALVTPIAGIEPDVVVIGAPNQTLGGASDLERMESYRKRVLRRRQNGIPYGAPGHYEDWAYENGVVTRAWERPSLFGPGTVGIYVVQDVFDQDGFFVQTIFLDALTLAAIQTYIQALAPLDVTVTVLTPTNVPLNPSIQLSPNTVEVQQQSTREMQDLMLRASEPNGTLLFSQLDEAISRAQGESDHDITSPIGNVTVNYDELLTLGTPTYSDLP